MIRLELRNIYYKYPNMDAYVLKNINMKFESGKTYAIVGPSGSGKSTLLSILAGLDEPTKGEIFIDGENLKKINLDSYRLNNISMVFQNFQLFPLLTAVENITFPLELKGVNKEQAKEIASEILLSLGIEKEKHHRFPNNLSGGEQQRVAIGRTLGTESKIIFADEPTGNLDNENGKKIIDILTDLAHNKDFCIIIVTHDMEIAKKTDAILEIIDGRLVELV